MKYKSCCNRRCLLANCVTRESGGCYCVCSIMDHILTLEDLINGTRVSAFIYFGDLDTQESFYEKNKESCDKYINEAPKLLEEAQEKLNKYITE